MRITVMDRKEKIIKVICNCCRKELPVENGIVLKDYIHVEKRWGYFSEKDGEEMIFDICEECTDKLVKKFMLPPYIRETSEFI